MMLIPQNTLVASEEIVIKIGILHSLTGTMAISERSLVDAAKLAVIEINQSGGILGRKLIAIVEDGASDWPTFAEKAEKLIVQDKVCAIFGCWTSASRKEVLPILEKYDHLLWYPVQYEGDESSPYVIYTGAAPNQQIIPAIKWCVENIGSRVFLVGSDYVFPRKAHQIVKTYLDQIGAQYVGEEYIPLGDKDFSKIIDKIRAVQPDVIFNTINGDSNIGLFYELSIGNITPEDIPVMSVSIAEDELRGLGTKITAGHYCAWNYFQSIDTYENHHLVESFKKVYGMDRVTDDPIEAAYFQVHLFAKAVAKAESTDPRTIREAARGLTYSTPGGLVRIEPTNQHTWKTSRIGKIQEDGQFIVVWSSDKPIRPDPYLSLDPNWASKPLSEYRPSKWFNTVGIEQLSDLIGTLYSDIIKIRQDAAHKLGQLGTDANPAVDALSIALRDEDWLVRHNASQALARIKGDAIPVLIGALNDNDNEIRFLAAQALESIGPEAEEAVPALVYALQSEDIEIRQHVCSALGQIGSSSKESVPVLIFALDDQDIGVRLMAAEALGRIGAGSAQALPYLTNCLKNVSSPLSAYAGVAIAQIATDLDDKRNTTHLLELQEALAAIITNNSQDQNKELINRAINHLKDIEEKQQFDRIIESLSRNKWVWAFVIYITFFILLRFLVLRWFPLWLLRINTTFEVLSEIRLPNWLGGFKLPINYFLLVGFFQYHPRVLDAWVKQRIGVVRENFKQQEAFRDLKSYIPVPISLDNNKLKSLQPKELNRIVHRDRWCLLICGEGGTGKTSLAYQLALWAMWDDPNIRLREDYMMLPILIEPTLGQQIADDIVAFKKTILGQLRALTGETELIPDSLFDHLLRKQRIIVIMDDLSSQIPNIKWALPADKVFPVAALIVTSRAHERLGNIPRTVIEPMLIEGELLYVFLEDYLRLEGHRDKFSNTEFFDVCKQLSAMAGQGQTTVLFAKMYAEYLIGIKSGIINIDFPRDIPDLMLGYLSALHHPVENAPFNTRTVHKASRVIAWECLKKKYYPTAARRDVVIDALASPDAEDILTYFKDQLLLIRIVGSDENAIRFALDPLAEYLAGLYLVYTLRNNSDKWHKFLDTIDCLSGPIQEINRFLLVVRECCLSTTHDIVIPSYLSDELARRANFVTTIEEPEPVLIGILHSLSGTMAISERPLVDAAKLAIDEINQSGGILGRNLSPIIEDGASDPSTFAKKAEKIILENRVCAIFGCWTSATRKAVLPVLEKYNHLLWYPLQYEGDESSPYVIYTGAAPNQQIIPAIKWCVENIGPRVFLVGSDYIFPHKANEIVKAYLKANGGKCVGEEYLQLGDKDFRHIVKMIKRAHPNVIFNTVNGDSNIGLFYELNIENISPENIPVMSVSIAEEEVRSIGTKITAGHYCAWNYFQSITTPENRRFVESFKKVYGMDRVTDDPIEAAYFQVHLFAKAVVKASSIDPRAIRTAIRNLIFHAPSGLIRIEPKNQHTWKTARIGRIEENGQFSIVWSSEKPIMPDPYPVI